MTFKHSPGKVASYREVTKYLPCKANTSALVVLCDKVTHELYDIDDIVVYTKRRIYDFGKENCDFLSEQCFNLEVDVWYEFQKAFLKFREVSQDSPKKISF